MSDTRTLIALNNPYWTAVEDDVQVDKYNGPCVGHWSAVSETVADRSFLTSQFSWTITDPATIEFIAGHSKGTVIDPMAGTGYLPYLLGQRGVTVEASDLNPPKGESNNWHRNEQVFVPVEQGDAVEMVAASTGETLLLSWPPYGFDACKIVRAFTGDRLIYIGETAGGCCAGDDFFELLDREWTLVEQHKPVQWFGIHDLVMVYDRLSAEATGGSSA